MINDVNYAKIKRLFLVSKITDNESYSQKLFRTMTESVFSRHCVCVGYM